MANTQATPTPDAPEQEAPLTSPSPQNGESATLYNRRNGDKAQETPSASAGRAAAQDASATSDGSNEKKSKLSPAVRIGLIIAAIVVVAIGLPWGLNRWHYNKTHVSTDDAYVTGNLVNVSPIISGTLKELNVEEGDIVRRGQLLARLDDAGPQATLRQAQASYEAALSQVPQAERTLLYQQQATLAAIRKAQAAEAVQRARINGAQQQVVLTAATIRNQVDQAQNQVKAAQAQTAQSQANAQSAQAAQANAQQAVQTAQAALENYRQAVQTAERAVQAASSRAQAAQSEADRAARDEERYRTLFEQDAVAQQVYDNARAQARNARAQLQAAQSETELAQSQVEQARKSVTQAQSQVEQARKSADQFAAQTRAAQQAMRVAQEQVGVAQAGLNLARANSGQVGIQRANATSTQAQTGETQADIATAQAGQEQIALRRTQVQTARAQAQQALAALTNAQITLSDTSIYAPYDGTIVRKSANTGASVSPGQTILTITQSDYVWVTANFKETQLQDVRPGQSAEVEVDSFPGHIFKGRVHSINEATGAATSLLPPDNATGNFTKVVQRIPVRIDLIPASESEDKKYARAEEIRNLRQGMSVVATIELTDGNARNGSQVSSSSSANGSGQGASGQTASPSNLSGSPNGSAADNPGNMSPSSVNGSTTDGTQASNPGVTNGVPALPNGQPGGNVPNIANPGTGTTNPTGQSNGIGTPRANGGGIGNGPGMNGTNTPGGPNIPANPSSNPPGAPGLSNPAGTIPGGTRNSGAGTGANGVGAGAGTAGGIGTSAPGTATGTAGTGGGR